MLGVLRIKGSSLVGLPSWQHRVAAALGSGATRSYAGPSALHEGLDRWHSAHVQRPKLVVLGTGWAAFSLVQHLDRTFYDVEIISPRNHMLFTPLLASTAVGTLDLRSAAETVRSSFSHNEVSYVQGHAVGLDTEKKTVAVEMEDLTPTVYGDRQKPTALLSGLRKRTAHVPYDLLVIAVGARVNTFNIPGVQEHCFFLKELADARAIRQRIMRNIEAAAFPGISPAEQERLLSFLVVGGGPTGVEFAAELHDFVVDLESVFPEQARKVTITIVEGRGILGGFDASLRDYAERRFKRDRINVRTGSNVVKVEDGKASLSDGSEIPFGLCVWNTGIAPQPFVKGLPEGILRKDKWGHVVTTYGFKALKPGSSSAAGTAGDGSGASAPGAPLPKQPPSLAAAKADREHTGQWPVMAAEFIDDLAETIPCVYALGDAASVGDRQYAATAQVAEQHGAWLGEALSDAAAAAMNMGVQGPERIDAIANYVPSSPFIYRHRGAMVVLGTFEGIIDFSKGSPVWPLYGQKIRGFIAWFIWRSAYFTKLGSLKNRLQVPWEWTKTFFFGRDLTAF